MAIGLLVTTAAIGCSSGKVSFQDGGETGLFKKIGSGSWQAGTGGVPPTVPRSAISPQTVLEAWSLATTVPAGGKC
jgi:hypothetical protein